MIDVLVAVVVVVVAIAAHELAHVAATRAVGHEIFEIQIGGGPLWSFRIGSVDVRIGAIPLGGHVQTGARTGEGFRWRTAVVAGAGIAANGALAVVGVVAGIAPMVVFNGLAAMANLWPGGGRRLGEPSSDGRLLLDLARGDADAIAEERSGWYCIHALHARDEGDRDRARQLIDVGQADVGSTRALLAVAGVLAFEDRRFEDVVVAYAPLIDDERVSVAGRSGFAADAAWSASLSDDPELRALAEPWAAFAPAVRPRIARRSVVLALALVDAGRPTEALESLSGLDDVSGDAVRVLALVAAGDIVAARQAYERSVAGGFEPGHPLAHRVEVALSTA